MGLSDLDLTKPLIGVANTWNEATPCNVHLNLLANKASEGIVSAGGTPRQFVTIAVSDGIAMGTEGMKSSLVSREVIADSVELMIRAHQYDGFVGIAGCDKSLPGIMLAMARLNLPSAFVYGGTIMPGVVDGKDVTIQDVFEAVGAYESGRITMDDLKRVEDASCPGAGSCGGLYTANTMACMSEALGLALPGSATPPAVDGRRGSGSFRDRSRGYEGNLGGPETQGHSDLRGVRERHQRAPGDWRINECDNALSRARKGMRRAPDSR